MHCPHDSAEETANGFHHRCRDEGLSDEKRSAGGRAARGDRAAQSAPRRLHRPADAVQAGALEREGPTFIALHKLFDEINEDVEAYVDLIAERIVQLGGIAEGTVGVVEGRSTLVDYPLTLSTGAEHVAALSDALAMFGRTVRLGIEELNELEDADSTDILTEISRGVDKWLWFVEAQQQGA